MLLEEGRQLRDEEDRVDRVARVARVARKGLMPEDILYETCAGRERRGREGGRLGFAE